MGCCRGIARFLLFALNLATFLIGLAFIIIGVIYEVGFVELTESLDALFPAFHVVPILLIVVGCIIFIISFFGCCGAWRQSSCMLLTYAVILIIILLLQIALAIYAFVIINNSDNWRADVTEALRRLFDSGDVAVDFLQQTLQCCGFDSPPVINIPASCCSPQVSPCLAPFQEVCDAAFYNFISYSINIIAIVLISLAAIEFIGAVIATCVSRRSTR